MAAGNYKGKYRDIKLKVVQLYKSVVEIVSWIRRTLNNRLKRRPIFGYTYWPVLISDVGIDLEQHERDFISILPKFRSY